MEDMKQRIKRGNLEQEKSDAINVGKLGSMEQAL